MSDTIRAIVRRRRARVGSTRQRALMRRPVLRLPALRPPRLAY